jgi:hypothetical protein
MRHATFGQCNPASKRSDILDMRRPHDSRRVASNVAEHLAVVDILLSKGVNEIVIGQAGNSND